MAGGCAGEGYSSSGVPALRRREAGGKPGLLFGFVAIARRLSHFATISARQYRSQPARRATRSTTALRSSAGRCLASLRFGVLALASMIATVLWRVVQHNVGGTGEF